MINKETNIQTLIDGFIEFKLRNRGLADRTMQAYRLTLTRLLEFFTNRSPLDATADDLLLFSGAWLHKRGIAAVSRRPHVAAIREFYGWLAKQKVIRSNPAESLSYPKTGRKLPRVMTLANAEKLMWMPDFTTFAGIRDGAMLALLVGCGMRISGLVGLNDSNLIQAEVDGKIRLMVKTLEKGGKERKIPVPAEADMLLRLYLEHPDLKEIDRLLPSGDKVLFVSLRNRACAPHEYHGARRRLNRRSLLDIITKYGTAAGIPADQLHPHALRHLYGTELAESDIDILIRQQLMGHSDAKSTEIYTHLAVQKLTRDADKGSPLGKIRTPVSDLLKRLAKQS